MPAEELRAAALAAGVIKALDSGAAAPVLALWTWPGGPPPLGALARELPSAELLPAEDLPTSARRLGDSALGVVDGPVQAETLESAAGRLRPSARLVVVASPRPEVGLAPAHLLTPRDLVWDPSRLAAAANEGPRRSAAALERLQRRTGGWAEPSLWLLSQGGTDPVTAIGSEAFGDFLRRTVISRLSDFEARVLGTVLSVDDVPLAIWRRYFAGSPPELAALEALENDWGLVGAQAPPPLLAGVTPAPASPGEVLERLGRAANALGRRDLVARLLRDGGRAEEAERIERAAPAPKGRSRGRRAADIGDDPAPQYRVRLFGSPTVARLSPEGREQELSWRLHRSLLCVVRLALAPDHRLPRDELIETLWPAASTEHVKRNFHPTLSCARQALGGGRGGGIVFRQGAYLLDPRAEWQVDAEELERHVARAAEAVSAGHEEIALDVLQDAWRLYRGPLLDGYDGDWLEPRREWMHRRYLGLLDQLGGLALRAGRYTLALDAYRSLLIEEPFEERIHLAVMEIYGHRGRRDLVRRQFVRLQELLKDLHVEPAEQTIDRYHQLMA